MLFDKPDTLVLLKGQSIEVYVKEVADVAQVGFSKKIVLKGKLLDKEAFEKMLTEYFGGINLENRKAVVVLAEELTTFKMFPAGPASPTQRGEEEQQTLIDKFFSEVEMDPNDMAKQVLPADEETLALVADKSLFSVVVDVLKALNWRVESVNSEMVFDGVSSKKILTPEQVESVFDSGKVLEDANFLSLHEAVPEGKRSSHVGLYLLSVLAGLVFLGALGYALYSFGLFKNLLGFNPMVKVSNQSNLSNYSEPVTKGEGSATLSGVVKKEGSSSAGTFLKKEEVKIQILNGSGVAGQAAKAQTALEKVGFKNFELGNSSNLSTTGTLYTYSPRISVELKKDLDRALESFSSKLLGTEATGSSSFDVNIILGK